MVQQSICEQIIMLQSMVEKLNDFSKEVNYRLITEPDKILKDSVSLGFPVEIAKRYTEGYLEKNIEDAKCVISDIQRLHIPYLERVIEDLKGALN
jgi:predicted nuclease of restriction endonuclease-like RecB superfamily